MQWFQSRKRRIVTPSDSEIAPDEIFLDSTNLPLFDRDHFEGRIEKPLGKHLIVWLSILFVGIGLAGTVRLYALQIQEGQRYAKESEENRLSHSIIFSQRGLIYDRRGLELAWNEPRENASHPLRVYAAMPGLSHVLGYVRAPRQDRFGNYYQEEFVGIGGVEEVFDERLRGINGLTVVESDALGSIQSKSVVIAPRDGENVTLAIDGALSSALQQRIAETAQKMGYRGGAGIMMDIKTGEVIAFTSYPEFDQNILTRGTDVARIRSYFSDVATPFLNRVVGGLYAPGSIVKPIVSLAALTENIVTPQDVIVSNGYLLIANPYDPERPYRFNDWKAHGALTLRQAIAQSSDVFFYVLGGGFNGRSGLGIDRIKKYMELFGVGEKTGIALSGEQEGVIPDPEWKATRFPDDPAWRLGDTYFTSIGQYGFQTTPIEMVRAVAGIATGGTLLTPTLEYQKEDLGTIARTITSTPSQHYTVVKEGMRLAVVEGTAQALNVEWVTIAAKTGTAQTGARNQYMNSWVTGFFPYKSPRYAFAVVMERAPAGTSTGAPYVVSQLIHWMTENARGYLEGERIGEEDFAKETENL